MPRASLVRLIVDSVDEPFARRHRGMRQRSASWRMRALALGLLSGLAASIALLLYDRRLREPG